MISWELATILSGLVRSPGSSMRPVFFWGWQRQFFPRNDRYLTHWIRLSERGRAVAILYAAIPSSAIIGAPLAGWLFGIGWHGYGRVAVGFLFWKVFPLSFGNCHAFYLTDWPREDNVAGQG